MSKKITRRSFVGGAASVFGAMALPAWGNDDSPIMTFGVVSDVHIGGRKEAPERLEFALRWLESRKVDAGLCPGDIAHSGLKSQFEEFAAVWQKVFPGSRDADGRKVELMISTGNHDVAPEWAKKDRSGEWCRDNLMETAEDFNRIWPQLFGERFEVVWRKEVKGVTFLGSQWTSLKPDVESFVRAQSAPIARALPVFYCQHAHPKGTCPGSCG
ncbi:MAG: metallophosphoesterase, partial [bacterium]|nr:metallophosphoesterase [Candidatus Colisoma equi]